ncbi:MAG TPA: OsmC family protein [Terriglobia bacterium]|nr:OsmC family protein [Terriglobia bacterium]
MEVKKAYKSFRYSAGLVWTGGRNGRATDAGKADIVVGSPPDFRGEEGVWSPEHLFISSLNTCLMLTFLAIAERRSVEVAAYSSGAEALLESVEGRYQVTTVTVRPKITLKSAGSMEAAREIVGRMEANCFISNSVKSRIDLQAELLVAAP